MNAPLTDLLSQQARRARSSVIREILALTATDDVLSLAGGMPNPETFPVDDLVLAARTVLAGRAGQALQYGATDGVPELRGLLAAEVASARSRDCSAAEVVVTTGSQQALDLLGRVLIDPGDEVAIDDPGYLGAIQALGARSPRWWPVPVDRDGLDTNVLEAGLRAGRRPKVVYTVTDFQNPSGAVLHPERRVHLAALAERWGFVVIEDDPYGAIRFGEPTHPSISTWTDRVVTLGTVSKTIAPGLRLGWLSAAPALVPAIVREKQAVDLHTSTLAQHLVLELRSTPGWYEARTQHLGCYYAERAADLVRALGTALPAATVPMPRGGLFVWLRLPGLDTSELLPVALAHGVAFVPGAAFSTSGAATDTARLTFATLSAEDLVVAAHRLAAAVRTTTGSEHRGEATHGLVEHGR